MYSLEAMVFQEQVLDTILCKVEYLMLRCRERLSTGLSLVKGDLHGDRRMLGAMAATLLTRERPIEGLSRPSRIQGRGPRSKHV